MTANLQEAPARGGIVHRVGLPVLVVCLVTAVGLAIRLVVLGQSPFGDEVATWWIVADHSGLGGVYDVVHSDAEISPPLFFLLSKLSTQIHLSAEMMRLPSLLAGIAAIPLTYLVGKRTLGRWPGALAAALVALSPFLIYYSTEARSYALVLALVLASTVALLRCLYGPRLGWWVAYGAFSCAAMYTHYTAVFPLAGQALWALLLFPGARRPIILANLGAALAFLPWLSGLIADFNSPTTDILAALQPFTWHAVSVNLQHWSVGYPYGFVPIDALPGTFALLVGAAGLVLAIASVAWGRIRAGAGSLGLNRGHALVVVLLLSAPVGEALFSTVSTSLFGARNLAVSWPGLALVIAAIVTAPPSRLTRLVASGLVVLSYGIGAAKMLEDRFQRIDFEDAAALIESDAGASDVVLDAYVFSPGPLSPLDIQLEKPHKVLRVDVPQSRSKPFAPFDPVASPEQVAREVLRSTRPGSRVFIVTRPLGNSHFGPSVDEITRRLSPEFQRVRVKTFPGIYALSLVVLRRSR